MPEDKPFSVNVKVYPDEAEDITGERLVKRRIRAIEIPNTERIPNLSPQDEKDTCDVTEQRSKGVFSSVPDVNLTVIKCEFEI